MKHLIAILLLTICANCFSQTSIDTSIGLQLKKDTVTKTVYIKERVDTLQVRVIYFGNDGNIKHGFGRQLVKSQYEEDTKKIIKTVSIDTQIETRTPKGKNSKGETKYLIEFMLIPVEFLFDVRRIVTLPKEK